MQRVSDAAEASSLELGAMASRYSTEYGGEKYIRMSYDTGTSVAVRPKELADRGTKVSEAASSAGFVTASGGVIPDEGCYELTFEAAETAQAAKLTGQSTDVHKFWLVPPE